MTEIRALCLRQPWAALILSGHKPVENRTWTTSYRGPLVVHAGQATVRAGLALAAERGIEIELDRGYLGLVDLVDIHEDRGCCHPWGVAEHYHFDLARPPAPLPDPDRRARPSRPVPTARQSPRRDTRTRKGGILMGFKLRKSWKIGPVRLNFTERGYSSWSLKVGRWSWNSRTRRHTIDTPGPGYWQS